MIEFDARYSVQFAEETLYSYFKWKFHRLPVLEDNDFPYDRFDNESIGGLNVENAEREDTTIYDIQIVPIGNWITAVKNESKKRVCKDARPFRSAKSPDHFAPL